MPCSDNHSDCDSADDDAPSARPSASASLEFALSQIERHCTDGIKPYTYALVGVTSRSELLEVLEANGFEGAAHGLEDEARTWASHRTMSCLEEISRAAVRREDALRAVLIEVKILRAALTRAAADVPSEPATAQHSPTASTSAQPVSARSSASDPSSAIPQNSNPVCKRNAKCTRMNCNFRHCSPAVRLAQRRMPKLPFLTNEVCASERIPEDIQACADPNCAFAHRSRGYFDPSLDEARRAKLSYDGGKLQSPSRPVQHPNQVACRYGDACTNHFCTFAHPPGFVPGARDAASRRGPTATQQIPGRSAGAWRR